MRGAQFLAAMIVVASAGASIWFLRRSARMAVRCAVVESIAALVMVGLVMWEHRSPWWVLPVWTVALVGALTNLWVCRRVLDVRRHTERVRALAKLEALVELAEIERGELNGRPFDDREQ